MTRQAPTNAGRRRLSVGSRDVRSSRRRMRRPFALYAFLLALAVAVLASGCATAPAASAPTPTPATPQARLGARIQPILRGTATSGSVTYDPAHRAAEVKLTLPGGVTPRSAIEIAAMQERVKSLCFQAQQALWTSGTPLSTITVSVFGPMFDDYADLITSGYGGAILTSGSAEQFTWTRLDSDSAWGRYDQTWLASEFSPYQQFWAQPTPTPRP